MKNEKVPYWWLNNCLVDLGELSLRENRALHNPRDIHSSSSVSAKDIIRNRNRTRAMLYHCLTPTLKSMYVSILPMTSLTTIFLYMRLIAKYSLGGAQYFSSTAMSAAWL